MALVVDTGPLYAALDRGDSSHESCRDLLHQFRRDLLIPAPVLVEVDQLAYSRRREREFNLLLADIVDGAYDIEDLLPQDYERVHDLMLRYADASIGFVDAAVLAVVERLGETTLATLDRRHFGLMRPAHVASIELLP